MNPQTELATHRTLLAQAERILDAAGVATPRLDAEVLLAAATRWSRAGLYTHLDDSVSADVQDRFRAMVRCRELRQPVAYITEVREFWSLPFFVTPAVLIPRPETEQLVQVVCELLAERRDPVVCDVGTGSGCIAIAVACEHPTVRVFAADVSLAALQVARRNAVLHGVDDRVRFVCSDVFDGISRRVDFDLVVSNPPYVPTGAPLTAEVSYEPECALFAGDTGMDTTRRLLPASQSRLRDGGHVVMELGHGQDREVWQAALASDLTPIEIRPDLAKIPRVLVARRSGRRNG